MSEHNHHFLHMHSPVRDYSLGKPVPSDWADKADDDPVFGLWKYCGCWTEEEREILVGCVSQVRGTWLDIGAATGLTTWYIAQNCDRVIAVEPQFAEEPEFYQRFAENCGMQLGAGRILPFPGTMESYYGPNVDGAIIDGDHEPPHPEGDVREARDYGARVILLHDFRGGAIWDAGRLLARDMNWRIYYTPHMVFLAWRDDPYFKPPKHTRDPHIDWERERPIPDWARAGVCA